jgi:hypothetical protein
MNSGEKIGLLNQSIYENSLMDDTSDEPSIIEEYKH